jgi:hypothetical protein
VEPELLPAIRKLQAPNLRALADKLSKQPYVAPAFVDELEHRLESERDANTKQELTAFLIRRRPERARHYVARLTGQPNTSVRAALLYALTGTNENTPERQRKLIRIAGDASESTAVRMAVISSFRQRVSAVSRLLKATPEYGGGSAGFPGLLSQARSRRRQSMIHDSLDASSAEHLSQILGNHRGT